MEESTSPYAGVGSDARLASMVDGSAAVPEATTGTTGSLGAEAGVAGDTPESRAKKHAVSEEKIALPEEITQTTEQRPQLIKRMEPLAKENDKLKEVMKLMERNIQRAQRERDLAESNAQDLEYQKGILFEQLTAMSEQLQGKSEQLANASAQLEQKSDQLISVSEQKIEQDAELGQLRQAFEQLQEEKAKETRRADKLGEELNDYRRRVKAQFDVLVQEARIQREKFNAVVAGVKPVLDCVNLEASPQPNDRPPHSNTVIERCKGAWENFKSFNRDAVVTKDGNGHRMPACPWAWNPMGKDTGTTSCPRAWAQAPS
ncbi:protein GRIP-like [Miscanthus floridulus]|uniref:protein GRIP-like n=1 Tax=Miscanthus floridulus TaxID=154761 RepID=UPI0034590DA6